MSDLRQPELKQKLAVCEKCGEEATHILKLLRKKYGFVGALARLLNVLRGRGAVAIISNKLTPSPES